jgi:hypothetical protein
MAPKRRQIEITKKNSLTLGSSKLFYSAEAPAPLKWGDFEPSLRINYIL